MRAIASRAGTLRNRFFRDVRSDDLAVAVVEGLITRSGIDPDKIEDCLMGNTQQQGEQGFCVARNIALMSGLPVQTGGATINRLCGSSLQAVNQGAHAIMSGFENVQIVGGLSICITSRWIKTSISIPNFSHEPVRVR